MREAKRLGLALKPVDALWLAMLSDDGTPREALQGVAALNWPSCQDGASPASTE
jgi:hypothetical protein